MNRRTFIVNVGALGAVAAGRVTTTVLPLEGRPMMRSVPPMWCTSSEQVTRPRPVWAWSPEVVLKKGEKAAPGSSRGRPVPLSANSKTTWLSFWYTSMKRRGDLTANVALRAFRTR